MKALLFAVCSAVVLAVPALSRAEDAPSPAIAACKAEYVQLGSAAFAAKYGANEPYQACVRAHGGATTTAPAPPTSGSGPEAECKAEYLQVGAAAFTAKYGANEPYRACIQAHGGATTDPPKPALPSTGSGPEAACRAEYLQLGAAAFATKYGANEPFGACLKTHGATAGGGGDKPKPTPPKSSMAVELAKALCLAEAKSTGRDSFVAKYGKENLGSCIRAAMPKAKSTLATCKAGAGSNRDAFKACVGAALNRRR